MSPQTPHSDQRSLSGAVGTRRSSQLARTVVLAYVIVTVVFFAAGYLVGRLLL
jgi:hypothetical protein